MCLISWERTPKRDQHKLFRGDFWPQKGAPNGAFSATKSLVYCLFPALIYEQQIGTDFGGRGCDEAEISEEQRLFTS